MGKKILSEEQKNEILNLFLNTKISYKRIAKDTETSLEEVYGVISEYCKENDYKTIRRAKNGVKVEEQNSERKKEKQKKLEKTHKIEEWADKKSRKPRTEIAGVEIAQEGEEETEEQEELRWGLELSKIKRNIVNKYEYKSLEEIEDKYDREIVRIMRELDEKYKDNRELKKRKERSLRNVKEIKKWADENRRRPRRSIKGVKVAQEGEKETKQQEEVRLGQAFDHIKANIVKEYEGINITEIENEDDREIVSIMRQIEKEYGNNSNDIIQMKKRANFVQTLGNEKMGKMIINLIKTKNATEEQVKTIAEFYGVDLEKVVNNREER